jgi:adenine-specific DNA-methyltransferase
MDEIFGRESFVTSIAWQQRTTRENRKTFSANHEYLLVYTKDYSLFAKTRNDLELTREVIERYKNPDNDVRGVWQSISANAQAGHATPAQFYTLVAPNGKEHVLPNGRCWLYTQSKMNEEVQKNNIWFGKDGNGVPRIKKFLSEVKTGLTPETLWFAEDVGTNDFAKKHMLELFHEEDLFDTPKPERLIQRILHIATNPNDLVLDSFLGSGTTAAVAHKMGRRYIGIEMGEHSQTHCIPRLQKVINGEQGGISKAVNWTGGGGFCAYTLGETIFDQYGGINEAVRFPALAAHIWQTETESGAGKTFDSPYLGTHNGTAYYLLYNGILGDRKPNGGNVLTRPLLTWLLETYPHEGQKIIYGEVSRVDQQRLTELNIMFKQIPYHIKGV